MFEVKPDWLKADQYGNLPGSLGYAAQKDALNGYSNQQAAEMPNLTPEEHAELLVSSRCNALKIELKKRLLELAFMQLKSKEQVEKTERMRANLYEPD